jgi:hypothetical protein
MIQNFKQLDVTTRILTGMTQLATTRIMTLELITQLATTQKTIWCFRFLIEAGLSVRVNMLTAELVNKKNLHFLFKVQRF